MPFQLIVECLLSHLYTSCVLLRSCHPQWMCEWVDCFRWINNKISVMGKTPYCVQYILSSNHQEDWCLAVGMLDKTLPLIHPWAVLHHNVQVHCAFGSAYRAIDKMPWGVACIYSVKGNQYIGDKPLPWKGMWTYWDTSREHAIGYALKLWVVLLCCGLTLQIICQEVIQHWESEGSFNLLVAWRKQPRMDQLLIPSHCVVAYAV